MKRSVTRLLAAAGLIGLIFSGALLSGAAGQTSPTVLHFVVRVNTARFHVTDVPPKGPSPGDSFQESNMPKGAAPTRRQDAIGTATFNRVTVLGAITLQGGQIVYAGSIRSQDNAVYAVVGGTGDYAGARGTLSARSLPRGRADITIKLSG